MEVAKIFAGLSHDSTYQVGAVIVKDGQILSQGWNGMPSGMDNNTRDINGQTRPEVIHAESNALMKLAKNGGAANGATLYCTHNPCYSCASLVVQSGISRIVYSDVYDKKSLGFLRERGISIECINISSRIFDREGSEG